MPVEDVSLDNVRRGTCQQAKRTVVRDAGVLLGGGSGLGIAKGGRVAAARTGADAVVAAGAVVLAAQEADA